MKITLGDGEIAANYQSTSGLNFSWVCPVFYKYYDRFFQMENVWIGIF